MLNSLGDSEVIDFLDSRNKDVNHHLRLRRGEGRGSQLLGTFDVAIRLSLYRWTETSPIVEIHMV